MTTQAGIKSTVLSKFSMVSPWAELAAALDLSGFRENIQQRQSRLCQVTHCVIQYHSGQKKNIHVSPEILRTLFHFEAQKEQYLHWLQNRHHSSLWSHPLNLQVLSTNHFLLSAAECEAPLGAGSHNKWSFCFLPWFCCCTTCPSKDHPAKGLLWTEEEGRILVYMLPVLFLWTFILWIC